MRDAGKNILGRGKGKCNILKLDLTVVLSEKQEEAIVLELSELVTEPLDLGKDPRGGLGGGKII